MTLRPCFARRCQRALFGPHPARREFAEFERIPTAVSVPLAPIVEVRCVYRFHHHPSAVAGSHLISEHLPTFRINRHLGRICALKQDESLVGERDKLWFLEKLAKQLAMSRFFLTRPIFAAVLAAILFTIGFAAIPSLPISQFPQIAPPTIAINATYPGANAEQVESSVTTPLEEAINGAPGLRYITSTSGNDGTASITATFNLSRDIDKAATDVLLAVQQANGSLPAVVKTEGITVKKVLGSNLLSISLYSDNPRYDVTFLSNYLSLQIVDPLKRVSGVGDIGVFGQRTYAMRIWLDPKRLADNNLTVGDIQSALSAQNVLVPAGSLGAAPAPVGQPFSISVNVNGQLQSPEDFANIVLKPLTGGGYLRLRDVGRVELGAENYANEARRNGKLNVGLGIQLAPGANALAVSTGVLHEMEILGRSLPPGVHWGLNYDSTDFVRESIKEVVVTLIFAIVLVILVIYIFLQDWRTTLIPAITIPVSLVGTFGVIQALGFSINTLTLFGMTLATGLVVDDAIVVIENIARIIQTRQHGERIDAASFAMREITGAVVAASLVLLAVFVPVGFFPGVTGELYKQFALTIACSISISLIIALTLTPALSVRLVKEHEQNTHRFFRPINRIIDGMRSSYKRLLETWILPHRVLVTIGFILSLAITLLLFSRTPSAFLPDEDLGIIYITIQAPQGTSLAQEERIAQQVEAITKRLPGLALTFDVSGRGLGSSGNGSNTGFLVLRLQPWSQRTSPKTQLTALLQTLNPQLARIKAAKVIAFSPPAVQGIGSVGGFQYELEDPTSGSMQQLGMTAQHLVTAANRSGFITRADTVFSSIAPQINLTVDRERAAAAGVSIAAIFSAIQANLGSLYINDFTYNNHAYHVFIQADAPYRSSFDDLQKIFVTSNTGVSMPISDFFTMSQTTVPPSITHYNLFRNIEITGATPPGIGSSQSLDEMEQLSKRLPSRYHHEWSGISLEQITSGGASAQIFALGLLFVFFVLAAQYESLIEPFIILLATPLALLGAIIAMDFRGLASDVYAQVGYVMLIGLAAKNAILIVEFANQLREQGLDPIRAVAEAAETRLRPILMTSFAFILGILPLVFATGAGAASRHSLGTAIFGGMLVSTLLNLAIIPALYVVMVRFDKHHSQPRHTPTGEGRL